MHSKCANCQGANGFFNVPKRGVKRVHQEIGLKRRHVAVELSREYGGLWIGMKKVGLSRMNVWMNLHASLRRLGGNYDACTCVLGQ